MVKVSGKVACVISYDSYWRGLSPLMGHLRNQGISVDCYLYDLGGGDKQVAQSLQEGLSFCGSLPELMCASSLEQYQAVFFGCGGKPLRQALERFHAQSTGLASRPVSVTLFPGIRAQGQFEGLAARAASDYILFNCADDIEEYKTLCDGAGIEENNAVLFGLPSLYAQSMPRRRPILVRSPQYIYFIDQNIIPPDRKRKRQLAQKLLCYAELHPHRKLVILSRDTDRNVSAHMSKYSLAQALSDVARGKRGIPGNLAVDTGSVEQVFEQADLCLSFSSTVALECMAAGIPVAFINDFGGIFVNKYAGSGCYVSFRDICSDKIPSVSTDWRNRYLIHDQEKLSLLSEIVSSHHSGALKSSAVLWDNALALDQYIAHLRHLEKEARPMLHKIRHKCAYCVSFLKKKWTRIRLGCCPHIVASNPLRR